VRKARLIYASEHTGFMADHKSVSAQLTLGNFPTPFSNQTPSPVAASQGDPPRGAEAASRALTALGSPSAQTGRLEGRSKGVGRAQGIGGER
jgi:hypothetical protein